MTVVKLHNTGIWEEASVGMQQLCTNKLSVRFLLMVYQIIWTACLQYYHLHIHDCTSGLHPLCSFTFPLSISFSLCDFADGYDIILINFYADWCRFSQQLKPIFEKAAETMAAEHSVRYCNILQTAYSQSCDYHVTVSIFMCMCYIVLIQQGGQGPSVMFGRVNCEAESECNYLQNVQTLCVVVFH